MPDAAVEDAAAEAEAAAEVKAAAEEAAAEVEADAEETDADAEDVAAAADEAAADAAAEPAAGLAPKPHQILHCHTSTISTPLAQRSNNARTWDLDAWQEMLKASAQSSTSCLQSGNDMGYRGDASYGSKCLADRVHTCSAPVPCTTFRLRQESCDH